MKIIVRTLIPSTDNFHIIHLVSFITARKRSLRRLCFYTCLSVILFTGEEYLGQVPLAGPPPAGTPPGRYTPGRNTPRTGKPPPPDRYPARQVHPQTGTPPAMHAGIRSTSGRYASYWNAFLLSRENKNVGNCLKYLEILKHQPHRVSCGSVSGSSSSKIPLECIVMLQNQSQTHSQESTQASKLQRCRCRCRSV